MQPIDKVLDVVQNKIIKPALEQGKTVTNTFNVPVRTNHKMSIKAVRLYKMGEAMWVFDDEPENIYGEAFVNGADKAIELAIQHEYGHKHQSGDEYVLTFSDIDYDTNYELILDHHNDTELDSYWKFMIRDGHDNKVEVLQKVWLCPTFHTYFDTDTRKIYFDITKCPKE